MTFRNMRFRDFVLPTSTAWLLSDIAESKGRQDLFTRQSPQILNALREAALIQSVESSNRIEGVIVEPARLAPLVLGIKKLGSSNPSGGDQEPCGGKEVITPRKGNRKGNVINDVSTIVCENILQCVN